MHKTLELDPNWSAAHFWLAESYALRGLADESVAEYLRWLRQVLVPGSMEEATRQLAVTYGKSGLSGFWRLELELAEEERHRPGSLWRSANGIGGPGVSYAMARRYARLGEIDEALASLDASIEQRESSAVCLNLEPLFDNLHADPRFQNLVRRVGLKP